MNIRSLRVRSLVSGLISMLPGGNQWLFRRYESAQPEVGTATARYCYSVWLRHLVLANKHGVLHGIPQNVAELGPGSSLGTGLAALLSGVDRYYAFDIIPHVIEEKNTKIFDELVTLFMDRADIPDCEEYPDIVTKLDSYLFPEHILTDEILTKALDPSRIKILKNNLIDPSGADEARISYIVPWNDALVISRESINMIISMSVMEHIDDPSGAYRAAYGWLKSDGFMSHEIDYTCHGHSTRWNGHWAYPDLVWRIIRGNRPYLINRHPHSFHMEAIREAGFQIIANEPTGDSSGFRINELAPRFRGLSEDDCSTSNAFILALKH